MLRATLVFTTLAACYAVLTTVITPPSQGATGKAVPARRLSGAGEPTQWALDAHLFVPPLPPVTETAPWFEGLVWKENLKRWIPDGTSSMEKMRDAVGAKVAASICLNPKPSTVMCMPLSPLSSYPTKPGSVGCAGVGCASSSLESSGDVELLTEASGSSTGAGGKECDATIMVLSARNKFEHRAAMRQTWASDPNRHCIFFFVGDRSCDVPASIKDPLDSYACKAIKGKTDEAGVAELKRQDAELNVKLVAEQAEFGNDVVMLDMMDFYRCLAEKVHKAYRWLLANVAGKQAWIAKADDDHFVRVSGLINYLTGLKLPSGSSMVRGCIGRRENVPRSGKWAERDYKKSKYPPFPRGSCGHAVTRTVAEYIAGQEDLFYYQGEDVSIGIWLAESPLAEPVTTFVQSYPQLTNNHKCQTPGAFIVGHNMKPEEQYRCAGQTAQADALSTKYVALLESKLSGATPSWEWISKSHSCEGAPSGILRSSYNSKFMHMVQCLELCDSKGDACQAVDWYVSSDWCNMYPKVACEAECRACKAVDGGRSLKKKGKTMQ